MSSTNETEKTNQINLNIAVIGKGGVGKYTISRALSEKYGNHIISTGEYLKQEREKDTLLGKYISNFWRVESLRDIALEYIEEELEKCKQTNKNFIICAPRTPGEAETREQLHLKHNLPIDVVLELVAPEEVLKERRQLKRADQSNSPRSYYESDDQKALHDEQLDEIRQFYKKQPHITLLEINASESLESTLQKLADELQRVSSTSVRTSPPGAGQQYSPPELSDEEKQFAKHFRSIQGRKRGELIQLMVQYGGAERPGYPVTLPVNLNSETISELTSRTYQVVRKLNGERRLVLITEGRVYLVNRRLVVDESLALDVPESWNESLLDSELVFHSKFQPGPSLFLLDSLYVSGRDVKPRPLKDRLVYLKSFRKTFVPSENDGANDEGKEKDDQNEKPQSIDDEHTDQPVEKKQNTPLEDSNDTGGDGNVGDENKNSVVVGGGGDVVNVEGPVLHVHLQQYYPLNRLIDLIKTGEKLALNVAPPPGLGTTRYASLYESADGLVFVPTHSRYNVGRSSYLLKWKPEMYHTVDFAMFREDPARNYGTDTPFGDDRDDHDDEDDLESDEAVMQQRWLDEAKSAPWQSDGTRIALKSLNKHGQFVYHGYLQPSEETNSLPDGTIVECLHKTHPEKKGSIWVFKLVRSDRTHPNSTWLVDNNMDVFLQPVQISEIVAVCKRAFEQFQKKQSGRPRNSSTTRGGSSHNNHNNNHHHNNRKHRDNRRK